MIRQRRPHTQHEERTSKDATFNAQSTTTRTPDSSGSSSDSAQQSLRALLWLLRLVGCLAFAYGFYLGQFRLCLHNECDMTYSMRMFLELDVSTSRSIVSSQYRLFKFIDQRDPRHSIFQQTPQPLKGSQWCLDPNQTTAVLYIPGHGGSYQQSRSLGAHGLQLTARQNIGLTRRALRALGTNEWTGNATSLESFVFDVYALDFGEEGAGLHGAIVERQSTMIADAVEFLVETCHLHSVAIVAHSIGGFATRLALIDYPALQNMVQNVVTLATPHAYPVFAIEPSLHRIFARLNQDINSVAMVSISGGLRDEMIPPDAVQAEFSMNLLATDIMKKGDNSLPLLGMDHRAIVWCHNLLLPVRHILFSLTRREGTNPQKRLQKVANALRIPSDYDYRSSLDKMRNAARVSLTPFCDGILVQCPTYHFAHIQKELGVWRAILSEIGLLYRIEALVGLYSVTCAMFSILGVSPGTSVAAIVLAPLVVAPNQRFGCSWGALLVQSLFANTVFVLIFVGAQSLSHRMKAMDFSGPFSLLTRVFLLSSTLLLACYAVLSGKFSLSLLFQLCTLAILPSILILFACWKTAHHRKVSNPPDFWSNEAVQYHADSLGCVNKSPSMLLGLLLFYHFWGQDSSMLRLSPACWCPRMNCGWQCF